MHYYQHNIGDYRRDTAHLSLIEHGVYRQLLDMYYLSESPIPTETQQVIRRLCARTDEETKAIELVLKEFFVLDKNGWEHKRCKVEIAAYLAKADIARINGKLGGRPQKTQPVNSGLSKITDEKANQLTNKPINHKPINQEEKQGAALPLWLDKAVWESFKKFRGRKFGDLAQKIMIRRLERFHNDGQNITTILETSIASGWSGVYPEKRGNQNGYTNAKDEARKRVSRELCGYDPDAIETDATRLDRPAILETPSDVRQ